MISSMTPCRVIAALFLVLPIFCGIADGQTLNLPSLEQAFDGEAQLIDTPVPGFDPDTDSAPENFDSLDVLTRGPLHEAFATAHQANPEASPRLTKAPPQRIDELAPEFQPEGRNVQWIPGYWAWDDAQSDYIWISGLWRDAPPNRRWVPGYWNTEDQGQRWISGFWADEAQEEVSYLPQPPLSLDQGPSAAAPDQNQFYVPGNWEYRQGNYRWLAGHWQPAEKNWIWVPARYIWTPNGCLYQSGYWDYLFEQRGTCFAPVHFKQPVYLASTYNYQPSFAIDLNVDFLAHLFVRPHCGHYYYGDWYSSNFNNFGYQPWVSGRSHFRSYDPLLTYYRCRRSSNDNQYSVAQYLSRQHNFYKQNRDYRPRPTFTAQFNFVRDIQKRPHDDPRYRDNIDLIRKCNYVRSYSVHRDSGSSRFQAGQIDRHKQIKYKRIQDQQRRELKRKKEQFAQLQRHRKQIQHAKTSKKYLSKLKLPPRSSKIHPHASRIIATKSGSGKQQVKAKAKAKKGPQHHSGHNRNLNKAIAESRRTSAQKEQNKQNPQTAQATRAATDRPTSSPRQRSAERKKEIARIQEQTRQRAQRQREQARINTTQVRKQTKRDPTKSRSNPSAQTRIAQQQRIRDAQQELARKRTQQQRDAIQKATREQARARQSEQARKMRQDEIRKQQAQTRQRAQQQRDAQQQAQRARLEQARRDQQQRTQQTHQQPRNAQQDIARKAQQDIARKTQQQRQAQQQAQRKRQHDAARKTQQDIARKTQQQRTRQEASRRRAQQQQQRDAARRAQQKSQRDAARKAQQQSQRSAARRAQQRQRQQSQNRNRGKKK